MLLPTSPAGRIATVAGASAQDLEACASAVALDIAEPDVLARNIVLLPAYLHIGRLLEFARSVRTRTPPLVQSILLMHSSSCQDPCV